MANNLNRVFIACSISALALAIVSIYYWNCKKRRKDYIVDSTKQPNTLNNSNHKPGLQSTEDNLIVEDCVDSSIRPIELTCHEQISSSECSIDSAIEKESSITESVCDDSDLIQFDKVQTDVDDISVSENSQIDNLVDKEESQSICLSISQVKESPLSSESAETNCDNPDLSADKMHLKTDDSLSTSIKKQNGSNKDDIMKLIVEPDKNGFPIIDLKKPINTKMENVDTNLNHSSDLSHYDIDVKEPMARNNADNIGSEDSQLLPNAINELTSDDNSIITKRESNICNFDTDGGDSGESSVDLDDQTPAQHLVARSSHDSQCGIVTNTVKFGQTFAQVLSSKSPPDEAEISSQTSFPAMQPKNECVQPPVNCIDTLNAAIDANHTKESNCLISDSNYPDVAERVTDEVFNIEEEKYLDNHNQFTECKDNHSQGSNDSGKGSSDMPQTDTVNCDLIVSNSVLNVSDNQTVEYNFEIPRDLCGKLIGAGGHNINSVKRNSGTNVVVKSHYFDAQLNICSIFGKKSSVLTALRLIRQRFPIKDHPNLTLDHISIVNPTPTIPLTQSCQLHLLPETSTEVILSCTIDAGHFFLQQPTHPTYPQLNLLDQSMTENYSQTDTPLIPHVHPGIICAAPTAEGWFRALIKNVHDSNHECDIMFVDYGGYAYNVPVNTLRQIRFDFMRLPFQAVECYLANVQPVDRELGWTQEATNYFKELAQGEIIFAFIKYLDNAVPCVELSKMTRSTLISINHEMVIKGFAQYN